MLRRKIIASAVALGLVLTLVLAGCSQGNEIIIPTETSEKTSSTESGTAQAVTVVPTTATQVTTQAMVTEAEPEFEGFPEPVYTEEAVNNEPCTINVDGKTYTHYIGDVVTYVFNLKTPEALEDFQASTNYDAGMLEFIETTPAEMFPLAGDTAVYNCEMPNVIKYNAVKISGMDYTQGSYMVAFNFRVLDSGGTAISTTLEYVDSVLGEPYVSEYRIVGDIQYSEEII